MTPTATFSTRRGRRMLLAAVLASLCLSPQVGSAGTCGAPATCNVLFRSPFSALIVPSAEG